MPSSQGDGAIGSVRRTLKEALHLEPGEHGAQTEVDAAAEGHVIGLELSVDEEKVRLFLDPFVSVGRTDGEHHPAALQDRLTV